MWLRCIILSLAIGLICFPIGHSRASSNESSNTYNADKQGEYLEEVLVFELRPKIMNVLRIKYGDFSFDSSRILNMGKSDSYPRQEFVLEGRVTKQDSTSDIIQITFKADFDGYKVSSVNVISSQLN